MKIDLRKYFLFHLAIIIAICIVIYTVFFVTLNYITEHGKEVRMPDVTGMTMDVAVAELSKSHFIVTIDSTYEPNFKPLAVLQQLPDSGSMVKEGRIVMLTVNMVSPPQIPMPNLVGLSYGSAEMLLRNNKLILADTIWKSDVNSAVLEQTYLGKPIHPGDMLAQGSKISLVVGNGMGNTEHDVRNVIGMSVDGARTVLNEYHLNIEIQLRDPAQAISDTGEATVFDQLPKEFGDDGKPNRIKEGSKFILIIN